MSVSDLLDMETDLPIGTLHVTNLLSNDNEETLQKMFSEFGTVKYIKIITEGKTYRSRKKFRYAFVTFGNLNSSAKAIRRRESLRVKIKFADCKTLKCTPNLKVEYYNITSSQLNILDLNDDCLFHITTFLSFEDKVSLTKISPRFVYLCRRSFRILRKFIYVNLDSLEEAFKIFGNNLEEMHNVHNIRILSLLSIHCVNLKVLSIYSLTSKQKTFHIQSFKRILSTFQNLESLSINHIALNGDILFEISTLPNLKSLSLVRVGDIESINFHGFVNLTQLHLDGISINSRHFLDLFNVVQLKKLIVRNANGNSDFNTIFKLQNNLEELTIDDCFNCDYLKNITTLQNLKKLYLHFPWQVNVSILCDIYFANQNLEIFCNKPICKTIYKTINNQFKEFQVTSNAKYFVRNNSVVSKVNFLIT